MDDIDRRNATIFDAYCPPYAPEFRVKVLVAMRKAVEAAAPPPHAPWRDVPITAGLLAEAMGPSAHDPLAQRWGDLGDRIEAIARRLVSGG